VKSVETYDFTTLYTTLEQNLIKNKLATAIRSVMKEKRLIIGGKRCFWTNTGGLDAENVISRVNFLIDNCYFTCGDLTMKQIIGIPMGLDSAPQIANLLLHEIEFTYFMECLKEKRYHICRRLSHTFRYIDDITVINGEGVLDEIMKFLYPPCLKLEKVNSVTYSADVLDLHIWIDPYTKNFCISTFDKRRQFDFTVTCMPFLYSNVSLRMCHNVVISQILRHSFLNDSFEDFVVNLKALFATLTKRGYCRELLWKLLGLADSRHKICTKFHKKFDDFVLYNL
jgi:hypothetical protein